jgi:hypothetical protein
MKNLSTNRILMVCGLLVAAGCVFFAFSGVEEKTAGPSINYLQPNAMSHAHSGFSNSGRNIENAVSYKTAIETKTAITSTTGYQPISSSTLEPSRSTFGTSFSGSNTVSSYSNASVANPVVTTTLRPGKLISLNSGVVNASSVVTSMATNITSVVATNGSLTTSTDNVTSDHQLAEPFSDAPVNTTTLYRLPGDPSEPFPDPEAPVGTGMAFLCLCATGYGVVKFKKSKNNN